MGYRIEYGLESRAMVVRVFGCTHTHAKTIAREIQREARRAAIKHLVLDVRGLVDRFGNLGALVLGTCRNRRVAVIDDEDDEALDQPFSEDAARRRDAELRYFADPDAALAWLGG
jgi:hypothetical protein